MRIAIFDYRVEPTNPAGGCHWRMLRALSKEHDFTVFSVVFDNPDPARIRWVRIPAPMRPLALLFLVYHLLAPLYLLVYTRRHKMRFDLVQTIESNFSFCDICYAHFCHRFYLRNFWAGAKPSGVQGVLRWLDHTLHAIGERMIYPRVRRFIVPSRGLAAELSKEYPVASGRTQVISNPIDAPRFYAPSGFDRAGFRGRLSLAPSDRMLVFVAHGHFDRKGLPPLLEALAAVARDDLRLVVVGGHGSSLAPYQRAAARLGIAHQVHFAGSQADIRPYLWSADAFILPSSYETFSLVAYEAAAAGLPLIATRTNGIDEILRDRDTGLAVERNAASITARLRDFMGLDESERLRMGARARHAVAAGYSLEKFVESWRQFYSSAIVSPAPEEQAVLAGR